MSDLRCGDWREVLADVEQVDALICDPPYGARTHQGHDAIAEDGRTWSPDRRNALCYSSMSPEAVAEFVQHWAPRVGGWMAVMSCSDLAPIWRAQFEQAGLVAFAPVSCVIRAMSVRLSGDGPSNWSIYLNVARKRTKEAARWGTLNGAYVVGRGSADRHIGGKPIALMNAIIRDYTRPGDLVCDPCAGMATTAIACESLGRRFVGAEIDPETHAKAIKRIDKGVQIDMFGGAA